MPTNHVFMGCFLFIFILKLLLYGKQDYQTVNGIKLVETTTCGSKKILSQQIQTFLGIGNDRYEYIYNYFNLATRGFDHLHLQSNIMHITKEEIVARQEKANQDNQLGWLDTEKMNCQGIKTSKPMCCTGYEPKERPFQIMLPQKPRW